MFDFLIYFKHNRATWHTGVPQFELCTCVVFFKQERGATAIISSTRLFFCSHASLQEMHPLPRASGQDKNTHVDLRASYGSVSTLFAVPAFTSSPWSCRSPGAGSLPTLTLALVSVLCFLSDQDAMPGDSPWGIGENGEPPSMMCMSGSRIGDWECDDGSEWKASKHACVHH